MLLNIQTNPSFQPEKEYALHVILGEILGVNYRILYAPGAEHLITLPNGEFFSIPDTFSTLSPESEWNYQLETDPDFTPKFDLLAFSFFLLSRLEELRIVQRDKHGRFPAACSWAFRHGLLNRPLVNECAEWLWEKLLIKGWKAPRKLRDFKWQFSCDVDHPRLWWSKADRIKTLAGAFFKRWSPSEVAYWLKQPAMYQTSQSDPYDVFDLWMTKFERMGHRVQFNFMGERSKESDCWYPLKHPYVMKLLDNIHQRGHIIGFHPSYESFDKETLFHRELDSLRKISKAPIVSGRQHYLRFSNPETWKIWGEAGLQTDSTLGFAEVDGFRCGICQDFPVFDVVQRKMLTLREQPLVLMDVTLAHYLKLSPDQAIEKTKYYHQVVKEKRGTLTMLWHNSSWNTPDWEPWKKVLHATLDF